MQVIWELFVSLSFVLKPVQSISYQFFVKKGNSYKTKGERGRKGGKERKKTTNDNSTY